MKKLNIHIECAAAGTASWFERGQQAARIIRKKERIGGDSRKRRVTLNRLTDIYIYSWRQGCEKRDEWVQGNERVRGCA